MSPPPKNSNEMNETIKSVKNVLREGGMQPLEDNAVVGGA